MNVLVIDIGGTNVKCLASGHQTPRRFPAGRDLTPDRMAAGVREAAKDRDYDAVTVSTSDGRER